MEKHVTSEGIEVEVSEPTKPDPFVLLDESFNHDKIYFYIDENEFFRWRRVAANGEIVGAATEGYHNLEECVANARRQQQYARKDYSLIKAR